MADKLNKTDRAKYDRLMRGYKKDPDEYLLKLEQFAEDMDSKYGKPMREIKGFSKGGVTTTKKKVPAIAISVGMVEIPKGKGKAKMMRGGMANKRKHMYAGGGSVTDNLKPMPTGPKGKGVRNLPDSVQMKMGFDPKS